MKKLNFLFFFLLFVFTIFAYGETHVSGNVSGDWTLSGSPYYVDGIITITQFDTLNIQAGVDVIFTGYYRLNVYGALLAIGNESNLINFSRNDTTGFSNFATTDGAWNGIRFWGNRSRDGASLLSYCSLRNSKAIGISGDGDGGAIYAQNEAIISIYYSQFRDNYASEKGGAICFFSAWDYTNSIEDCYFYNNNSLNGGAFYAMSSPVNLTNNIFEDNHVLFDTGNGGAVYLASCIDIYLVNCLFYLNSAHTGGAIYSNGSSLNITNCTFTENNAVSGSVYYDLYGSYGSCTFTNDIFWNNSVEAFEFDTAYGPYNAYYSDIQHFSGATWNNTASCIDLDPLFTDIVIHDYTLSDGSPCQETGKPDTTGLHLPDYDLAHNNRVAFDYVDMGCYETQPATITLEAGFSSEIASGYAPLEVVFIDQSIGATSWAWDFNNDSTIDSYEQNPTYIYNYPGFYTVSLTVSDGEVEDTETKIDYINVIGTYIAGGPVQGEWQAIYSPYIIGGDIILNTINNLNIGPGVEVLFEGNYRFDVYGVLEAEGTIGSGNNILFSVVDTTGYSQGTHLGWNGLRFYDQLPVGSSILDYCNFEYGKSFGVGDLNRGGALHLENCEGVSVGNSTISKCMAEFGGGISLINSTPFLNKLTFSNNFASSNGGAIYCFSNCDFQLNNSLLIKNNAGINGSVLFSDHSAPILTNLTMADNNLATPGTGHVFYINSTNAASQNINMKNCIIWDPSAASEIFQTNGAEAVLTYTNIRDGWAGTGNSQFLPDFQTNSYKLTVIDASGALTNLLVDGGDPASDFSLEPQPNGGRINMGAYGGTAQATISAAIAPPTIDGVVVWNYNFLQYINQPLAITTGSILEIQQGTQIEIAGDLPITISGELTASAIDGDPIRFTSDTGLIDTGAKNTTWQGLVFDVGASESSVFNNVIIENAINGINLNDHDISIENTDITFDVTELGSISEAGIILGSGSNPSINDCDIEGYATGISIHNDLRETTTPTLTNTRIRCSTESTRDGEIGIAISGDVAANIDLCDIVDFPKGIQITGTGVATRDTPTLTNTRIRSSTEPSKNRVLLIGLSIENVININVDADSIIGYPAGIVITHDGRAESTPTLTNTRIRSSTESSRSEIGLVVSGVVALSMNNCDIEDYNIGIDYNGYLESTLRTTPVLTNTRIRTSTESSKELDKGIKLTDMTTIDIIDFTIEDYNTGIEINNGLRDLSTPTLTNTRIRSSTESSKTNDNGLSINGYVAVNIDNCDIDDQTIGINYIGTGEATRVTPTITNTRIRTSTESSRGNETGIFTKNVTSVEIDSCEVENYSTGIAISDTMGITNTPTITNTRIRTSTESSRTMYTGLRFTGKIDGNISYNEIVNVDTAIVLSGINVTALIEQNLIYMQEYINPDSSSIGIFAENCSGITIRRNTIFAYDYGYSSINTSTQMVNNIIWNNYPQNEPVVTVGGTISTGYCNISRPDNQIYPGNANINTNPLFYNAYQGRFELLTGSPCIDSGDPIEPNDPDGSYADMGIYFDPFLIDFDASHMFGAESYQVSFSQQSAGFTNTSVFSWDIDNDGDYDIFGQSPQHTYAQPGIYSIKLKVTKAGIADSLFKENLIVIQQTELDPPQNAQISFDVNNVILSWDEINISKFRKDRDQLYYLIYLSDRPDGSFEYLDYTVEGVTSYTHENILQDEEKAFYMVVGYVGTWREFSEHISRLKKYHNKTIRSFK